MYSYYVPMGSINISIKEEAYKFLKSLKSRDASFSDVILEMKDKNINKKGSKENVLKFAGVLKDAKIDWNAAEKRMKDFRESFDKRVEKTREYMEHSR